MNLDRVTPGRDLPDDFNVIIEIPLIASRTRHIGGTLRTVTSSRIP